MPEVIEKQYRGSLLSKILAMPNQKAISFEDAINVICKAADEAFSAKKFGVKPRHYNWYINNFVEYIAELGFHIELTGEEFDVFGSLDHVTFI